MQLKYQFIIQQVNDLYMAVATGADAKLFNGMVKLNKTGKEIFELLQQPTTEDAIISALQKKYTGVKADNVHALLQQFTEKGLLKE